MMLPCRAWIADPAGQYLGDGHMLEGWVVEFDGSTALVVFDDGSLSRREIGSISIRMDAAREAGLIPPRTYSKPPGPESNVSERPPRRSEST